LTSLLRCRGACQWWGLKLEPLWRCMRPEAKVITEDLARCSSLWVNVNISRWMTLDVTVRARGLSDCQTWRPS
jgi:hypothetical protein